MAATIASPAETRAARFTRFAWGVLGWNLLVVLWGAYVRASGSGAGCGSHWPLCNGEVVPAAPQLKTIIEFTHRMMSAVALLAVGALWLWSRKAFAPGSRVRKMALASVVFLLAEAALGAGLVLFDYVAANASVGRAVYLSLHLVNTQFLLAMLTLTAWFSREAWRPTGQRSALAVVALPAALLVSVAGTIAALGDTLFPATSLADGLRQDLSGAGSYLLRLRILHPALAILAALYFVTVSIRVLRLGRRIAAWSLALALAQLAAGAVNVALLAPIWMQITHLLLANLLWIALVLLAVEAWPGSWRTLR